MEPFFIMNRKGFIELKLDTPNQCKAVGHRNFYYYLRMVFDGNMQLDKRQFILDHAEVDQAIQKIGFIGSCEQIHQVLMHGVATYMDKRNIPMWAARCVLKPAVKSSTVPVSYALIQSDAWLEYVYFKSLSYRFCMPMLMVNE